jgi:hypothetical protein
MSGRKTPKLADFQKGDQIGAGLNGTVYTTEPPGYAIKIAKIFPTTRAKCLKYKIWREIEFGSQIQNEEWFIKLYDFKIEKCDHVQNYFIPFNQFEKETQENFAKLILSKWCLIGLWSKVDMTLSKIDIYRLNSITCDADDFLAQSEPERMRQRLLNKYSLCAQYFYIVSLMKKDGYIHCDFHAGNVGIRFVEPGTILQLGSHSVPSFGKHYVAIDYGQVRNKKYPKVKGDDYYFEDEYDENLQVMDFTSYYPIYQYCQQHNIIPTTPEKMLNVLRQLNIEIPKITPPNKHLELVMYRILHSNVFNVVAAPDVKDEDLPRTDSRYLLDEDYAFICANWQDNAKLINYFSERIQTLQA